MNYLTKVVSALVLLSSVSAFAESVLVAYQPMKNCGGFIELRRAPNGDLAIKLIDNNTNICNKLSFYDVSSGVLIKSYEINPNPYTLSKNQLASLAGDCRLGVNVDGARKHESFDVTIGWLCQAIKQKAAEVSPMSYKLSKQNNCKKMRNGQYTNVNVDYIFCFGAKKGDVVTYSYSEKGNCKRMINDQFSPPVVDSSFCTAR